jgi:DNA-binding NarL/FixJ family response regulator
MKILIADDHWVVRESLKQVLRRLNKVQHILEAASFDEAQSLMRVNADIDLMLADLVMPGFQELDGLQQLRFEFPEVPVVVVSIHEDREHVMRAIAAGVIGYIPKSSSGEEIEKAFERVLSGEVYFPRRLLAQPDEIVRFAPSPKSARSMELLVKLTEREREVLDQIGKGFSIQKVAGEMGISGHTVRVHLGNLMKKLGITERSEVIHFAISLANGGGQSRQ